MNEKQFIQYAKRLKEVAGISYKKQAEAIGMDNSTYCKIIRGERNLPFKYKKAITLYFQKMEALF